ncbi:MAG TPA: NUDIX hydrolase [Sandaracinaceae bacterium LLY-WYZ-13_1]|nr:NUDIX hydrolase [Sandaracinaceae bacterium LLY-WYZ-13_1]
MLLDPPIRLAYRTAHLMLRSYWFVRRPRTSGALAAVWHDGRILMVKNSYRRQHTLPGGYVRPGEDPRDAASRELREEVRIAVPGARFELAYHGTKDFEFRRDTLDIYETQLAVEPTVEVDAWEVVWAGFRTPEEARAMPIVPHLREYLEAF